MSPEPKTKASLSDFEVDSQDLHLQSKTRSLRLIDSIRIALTVVALLAGITVLGMSANALSVYNATHVSGAFYLPLWPDQFNLQPTVSLVIGNSIIVLANIVSLLFSKVTVLRNNTIVHTSLTFIAPLVGLIVAVISIVFFYVVNSSDTVDTLISWSCQWQVVSMLQAPHFATLCRQSLAGLYLSILLIPLEAVVLSLAGWQLKVERHTSAYARARGKTSPVGGS